MKVRYSPLISQASGSAGPIVASRWKGINYFRERIIPANPKSADQITQRGNLARCVAWWHDLEEQLTDFVKSLAVGLPFSGFNAFTARNLKDMYDEVDPRIVPLNAPVNPVTSCAHTPGGSAGSFDLSWVQGEAAGTDKAYILAGTSNVGADLSNNLFLIEKDTTLISAGGKILSGLDAGAYLWVYLLVEVIATSQFSIARAVHGQVSTGG